MTELEDSIERLRTSTHAWVAEVLNECARMESAARHRPPTPETVSELIRDFDNVLVACETTHGKVMDFLGSMGNRLAKPVEPERRLAAVDLTPDADALLAVMRDESGSNTRTESVQTIGKP